MGDFVVIGAGAAGAALAHRLSSSATNRVVVLESGPDIRPERVADPAAWPTTLGTDLDYGYRTVPQAGLGGRWIDYPRGHVLGGSTCLNAMIHMRPEPADTEEWGPQWSAQRVEKVLIALEEHRPVAGMRGVDRGTTGPVPNGQAIEPNSICQAFVAASAEYGYDVVPDVNLARREADSQSGAGLYDLSIAKDGTRADAAQSYLRPFLDRPNLQVEAGWRVNRLELSPKGEVVALHGSLNGTDTSLTCEGKQVILCAGAIDSPALLLRSGIGPADRLCEIGIASVVDLAGVGRNLHDHPAIPVVWASEAPLDPPRAQFFESVLALYRHPDLGGRSALASFGHLAYLPPEIPPPAYGATALIGLLDPVSRGSLTLDPDLPDGPPRIDPALLTGSSDGRTLAAMLEIVRRLAETDALSAFGLTELLPDSANGDIETYVRAATGTYFHPVGTCRLGEDDNAVTDSNLRVRGVRNLRVADASVIPRIPTAAPSVTCQLIGWHAAELLDPELSRGAVG